MLEFITKKSNPKESFWTNVPEINIDNNEILLEIKCLSLTANNISYAITGEKLGYWDFFPNNNEIENNKFSDFGKIPAWGFAKVIQSKNDHIQENEVFYGYFPFAQYVKLEAQTVSKYGFLDTSTHRQSLPAIYNFYVNTANDVLYKVNNLPFQATFRPLFTTAFLLDNFLLDNNFFEAQNIILTSASSKTSLALAFLLKERKQLANNEKTISLFPNIIGLTSAKNQNFVENTKLYDKTILYENLDEISKKEKICVVDFAGNLSLHEKLYDYFEENLVYNCLVGASHWENTTKNEEQKNPNHKKGKFFFAPTHAKKYIETFGNTIFHENIANAWHNFTEKTKNLLTFEITNDTTFFSETFQKILLGDYPPDKGFILMINDK